MTWMVGDDIEAERRCMAVSAEDGLRPAGVLPDAVERGTVRPDAILSSIADFPDWLEGA